MREQLPQRIYILQNGTRSNLLKNEALPAVQALMDLAADTLRDVPRQTTKGLRPVTPEAFDAALLELGWKGTDFGDRTGLVPNTVWRWRSAAVPIPRWADEYLRAMLAIQRLHAEFVQVLRPGRGAGTHDAEPAPPVAADADA